MKKYAIIVAGGIGSRMGSTIPKQFLQVDGKPIIVQTIIKFLQFDKAIEIILVLPKEHEDTWHKIHQEYLKEYSISITSGGATRSKSVLAGLQMIKDHDSLVAIHDAVRPFVNSITIKASFDMAQEEGSGVVCVPLKDSIREIIHGSSRARDRGRYVLMQTPQTFKTGLIISAYNQVKDIDSFTDDATVYEHAGGEVFLIDGDYGNIKITTPEDLAKSS